MPARQGIHHDTAEYLNMIEQQAFDITRLHAAYAWGLSAAKVVSECYRRIAAVDDPGIFLSLRDQEEVLAEAAALGDFDPVGKPLWGIPFAIKDNIDATGLPTTAACPDYAYVAEEDAFVVRILRNAGALLIGKTNLDQFATGLAGVRTPYPVPRNAIDPDIVPGGSSSGSATAVAHGIVSFSLGTDTAGSGRVPAALNNIVGLKPSLGALSNTGVVPACRTLDTVSVFALTVEDAYRVFRVANVYDDSDPYARQRPSAPLAAPPPALTIGVPDVSSREFFGDDSQAASYTDTLDTITRLGGKIVEIDFTPFYQVAKFLYDGAWIAERYAAVETFFKDHADEVHPVTRQIIGRAETLSAVDVFKDFYQVQALKRQVVPVLERVDMLCVPTIPTVYSLTDLQADPVGPNSRLGTYTNFVNLLDLCGIAVPVSPCADSRPGHVTLLARAGLDANIAAFASRLQQACQASLGATGWSLPAPGEPVRDAGSDEIALAVVGAHMSGLPLNQELTRLGGRFLRATKTAPCYRLYSLPGGPPYRPGLMQDEDGSALDLEIWALPSNQFGNFIRGVPAPLGIGTVTLEDGGAVKGFICEPRGIKGAEEITQYGGWRAYLQSITTSSSFRQPDI